MVIIRKFTDLIAWNESHTLVLNIYARTKKFPKDELFGLTSQMRRSAVSVTSNIAEGFGRHTFKDKVHFFYQARGSLAELRNQLIISRDLSYMTQIEYNELEIIVDKSQRLLQGLITSTNNNNRR